MGVHCGPRPGGNTKYVISSGVTTYDPYFNDVSLLLHMDGTDGSTTFTDESNNGFTVTANGNAQIDTAQSKYGGASGLFDGTGDYVTVPHDLALRADGDFTIEAWVRLAADPAGSIRTVLSKREGGGSTLTSDYTLYVDDSVYSGAFTFWVPNSSGIPTARVTSTTIPAVGTWYHVAAVRSGTTWRLFIDGVLEDTDTESAAVQYRSSSLYIGRDPSNTSRDFNGHIDDLRITDGVARYTSNFTPPTEAFPDTFGDPDFASVSLLLPMDGTDGSTTFTDESNNALTVTTNGNAQIDTAQSKYGGASGLFDGTGDYLTTGSVGDYNYLHDGSIYTLEMWVRFDTAPTNRVLLSNYDGATVRRGILLYANGSGNLDAAIGNGSGTGYAVRPVGSTVLSGLTWYHVALVCDGTNLTIYLDGVEEATAVLGTTSSSDAINVLTIAARSSDGGLALDGHIDDLRITDGVARYTSNFTPPTEALPTS